MKKAPKKIASTEDVLSSIDAVNAANQKYEERSEKLTADKEVFFIAQANLYSSQQKCKEAKKSLKRTRRRAKKIFKSAVHNKPY